MTSLSSTAIFCVERCLFLAGEAHYIHMGRRFRRRGSSIEWTDLLLPIAVVVCVVGIAWLVSRYLKFRAARNAVSPQALFAELCHAHGVDWPNQQLLRAIATANRLPSLAQLFVEPEHFDVERLGTAFESRKEQVAALHSKLFADSAGEAPNAS